MGHGTRFDAGGELMTPLYSMEIGRLVRTSSDTKHHGWMGVVVGIQSRWASVREDELLVTVHYPESGEELAWSEHNLEILA